MRRATSETNKLTAQNLIFQSTLSMRRATLRPLHIYLKCATFQSTLSMRRATILATQTYTSEYISIHALHEESDAVRGGLIRLLPHFNPRSP